MKTRKKIQQLVLFAFFIAIELVLMFTPLGYIPIGPIRATTMHIPVIICGMIMGSTYGALLGGVFGATSVLIATTQPTIASFIFSPFITIGGVSGNFSSLLIAFIPRILLGYMSGCIYTVLKKKMNEAVSIIITAVSCTFMHTILVMSGIYVFFAEPYAAVQGVSVSGLFGVIIAIIFSNGVMEMILAACIALAVVKATKSSIERMGI